MGKKIIVAGAGHGGLAAAALLAKAGFDVTVYERSKEGTLGYDWTDIFAPSALKAIGIELPPSDQYTPDSDRTFYSFNQRIPLKQTIPDDKHEIKIERKFLYSVLTENALKYGVKFSYDCNITAPILYGNRVAGIKTSKGDFYADLIIDAAGMESPVRKNLPDMCGIEHSVGPFEQFYVYRAFYNRPAEVEPTGDYNVYFYPNGHLGIAWVVSEAEYTDLLLGRFVPFTLDEAETDIEFLRKSNPVLGDTVLRGGEFVRIPVRQPLSVMVCDGYAAIGDSAFMTIPIIGSGIANSFKAARMLADTILADNEGAFSADTLWNYQLRYYDEIGAGLASVSCVKTLLTKLTPDELDKIFETGMITAEDFTINSDNSNISTMLSMTPLEAKNRLHELRKDGKLTKKFLSVVLRVGKATAATKIMPKKWNRSSVFEWSKKYKKAFE